MNNRFIKHISLFLSFVLFVLSVVVSEATVFASDSEKLPSVVDNSQSKYFPTIESQGDQGSCACWGQGYYQFTYMFNKAHDITTTKENSFSALWLYNLANGGRSAGTWDTDLYGIMKEIGCLRQGDAEFSIKDDQNWYPTEELWKTAMKYRISSYEILDQVGLSESQITSNDDEDLFEIKKLLADGEVLSCNTFINSWKVGRIKENQNAPENANYANEYVVMYEDGAGVRHRITIVGYNDNIWTDVNGNDKIDNGELGAFKIANSWGTDRHNKGYMWIAYDAVNKVSSVSGTPVPSYRAQALEDITSIDVAPYDSDTDLYFRYTLNTKDRGQARMYATATKGDETYTFELGPKRMHGMYANHFSYDGTTDSNDGTMVYALSNVVPQITSETLHEYEWSIKFEDNEADGTVFTVKSFEIVDDITGRVSSPKSVFPIKLDGSSQEVEFPAFDYAEPTAADPETITVYYNGFDEPYVHYRFGEGEWVTQPMSKDSTYKEYPYSFAITLEEDNLVSVYFTNSDGVEDNNNGTFYMPAKAENFYAAEPIYGIVGDSNQDSGVNINDATLIQKYVGALADESRISLGLSDCDKDEKVTVKDATCIQKYIASVEGTGDTGSLKLVSVVPVENVPNPSQPTPEPTEEISETVTPQDPTEPVTQTQPAEKNIVYFTNSQGWSGDVYCYYWSDANTSMTVWPGSKMSPLSVNEFGESVYTFELPDSVQHIIFTNGSVQTVDIDYTGGEVRYYADGQQNGKFTVKQW